VGLEKQVIKILAIKFSDANWLNQELKIVMVQDSTLNRDELEIRVNRAHLTLQFRAEKLTLPLHSRFLVLLSHFPKTLPPVSKFRKYLLHKSFAIIILHFSASHVGRARSARF